MLSFLLTTAMTSHSALLNQDFFLHNLVFRLKFRKNGLVLILPVVLLFTRSWETGTTCSLIICGIFKSVSLVLSNQTADGNRTK